MRSLPPGCEQAYTDTASGALAERPGPAGALSHPRPGDTPVVWRLDRFGRSLVHLIDAIADPQGPGIGM
ncbi:recombinase family protein [Geodermatophilus siccatus]|uniref:recombinase family protein n=1 Tax=Geodermatophilus siccatus TaxID=1137991 RepID=UPI001FDFA7F9|nr:recombinase family protein [Geodermatophilus siccatus]